MAVFLGGNGNIRLRRSSAIVYGALSDEISSEDINTNLNRLGFDKSADNLITGDRVFIETDDPRGLVCFAPSNWVSGTTENSISAYVNVNAVGGLRFFDNFANAINNTRASEYSLAAFAGSPLPIRVIIRDIRFNVLGNVTGYQFNTDREVVDTTSLSDKFKRQYSAGLISGNGSIDCLFDYKTTGIAEPSILMLQLIQRIDIGSEFDLALYLSDDTVDPDVDTIFYKLNACVTRAGIDVNTSDAIKCTIDFVSTGEIQLLIGKPSSYFLTEQDDKIELQQSLDYLLMEAED